MKDSHKDTPEIPESIPTTMTLNVSAMYTKNH